MKNRWLFGLGAAAGAAAAGTAVARARQGRIRLADRIRRLQGAGAAFGKNIVVLGAGFAGINAACRLVERLPAETGWTVTLVDRHNYFLFTPLLYHAAAGLVEPAHILFPVRSLRHEPNLRFREATVQAIDLRRRVVHLDDGRLSYDYLVLALGSVTNFFGSEEKLRHAVPLKTCGDAILVRNRIIDAYERADISTDPEERRRCLTFAVVGGGATGIELAGAIRGLVQGTMKEQYPGIRPEEAQVHVYEAAAAIIPGISREMAEYALNRLKELGVQVHLQTRVADVDAGGLHLKTGEYVPSRTVVWAAGVKPSPIAAGLDVPKVENGRIIVDQNLEIPGCPNCFVAGDVAAFTAPGNEKPLPPNAQVAVQQGRALADIIAAKIEGRRPEPFRYHHMGELVSLGRNEALAEIKGVRLTGFPAWVLWRAAYLSKLMGFKNRLAVALDWTFAYMYQRNTVRLDVPMESAVPAEQPMSATEERVPMGAGR